MALQIQRCDKDCIQVQWSVVVPRVGSVVRSDDVVWGNHTWNFMLHNRWKGSTHSETWTVIFRTECLPVDFSVQKFMLTAHARYKGIDRFMAHKEISDVEAEIWSYTRRSLMSFYPDAENDGNILMFVFTLENGVRYIQSAETEHKSAQTSPYVDNRLCLENLSHDFSELVDEGLTSDMMLNCGGCFISAHRVILRARSGVFRDMLISRDDTVEIVDMELNVLKIFIRYLYTATLPHPLTEDIVKSLYEAGDKYRVETLKRRCSDLLAEHLTPENACGILVMADAHSDKALKDRVVSYVINEKIPTNEEEWTKFYGDQPNLAYEVLIGAYKQFVSSQ